MSSTGSSSEPPPGLLPPAAGDDLRPEHGYPALPARWRLGLLALVVTQFLVGHGPIWQARFDWDRMILWSYATIPPLVAGALWLRRRLVWRWFLLHTLEIALAKFVVTVTILLALLIFIRDEPLPPPPRPAVAQPTPAPAPPVVPAPPPRPLPTAAEAGAIAGVVVGPTGLPAPGAILYLSPMAGAFGAPSEQRLELTAGAGGFRPEVVVGHTGQPLLARSGDGVLHTLQLSAGERILVRNLPLLASGAPARVPTEDLRGVYTMRCTVHGAVEGVGHLLFVPHPFVTRADEVGAFLLEGVPAGDHVVQVLAVGSDLSRPGSALSSALEVRVGAGQRVDARVALAPSPGGAGF